MLDCRKLIVLLLNFCYMLIEISEVKVENQVYQAYQGLKVIVAIMELQD